VTPPTAADDCSNAAVSNSSSDEDNGCPYNFTRTIIWSAEDACGNPATATTIITVRDTEAPALIGSVPADTTATCTELPEFPDFNCSDNCDGIFPATKSENDPGANGCVDRDVVRTWTCTDSCGHSTPYTQTIHVGDEVNPELHGVPDDTTIECDAELPGYDVTASDNCDQQITPSPLFHNITGTCLDSYTLNRTWTATDACGNSVSDYQLVHVQDTAPPSYNDCDCSDASCVYCDRSFSCEDALPGESAPSFSDNCDDDVEVTPHHDTISGFCRFTYTKLFAWRAVDNCGNTAWRNYTYIVSDETLPTFTEAPENFSVSCDDVQPQNFPNYTDNCGIVTPSTDSSNTSVPGACQDYTITNVYTIVDECDNGDSITQIITVFDNEAPVFDNLTDVNDFSVECSDLPLQPFNLTAHDNCGAATVALVRTPLDDSDNCPNTFQERWTWTATDACGNTANHSIIVSVVDTTPPQIVNAPEDETVSCDDIPCPANVTATDNCIGLDFNFLETRSSNDTCDYTLTRTWSASDACGNPASATQTIHVIDEEAPTFTDATPADVTAECFLPPQQERNATDNCNTATVTESNTTIPGGCAANYTTIYTWTASDACGNSYSENQTVTVHDTIPPEAETSPPICVDPFTNSILTFHDASVSGEVFSGSDLCSSIHIEITGCRSNQDELFTNPPLDLSGPFTEHCYYDNVTDELVIVSILIPTVKEGRVFLVTGDVVDACGHRTPVSRLFYFPLDENSPLYIHNLTAPYELPPDFDLTTCVHSPISCVENCPCEADNKFCVETSLFDSLIFWPITNNSSPATSYDAATDTTTFGFQLQHGGSVPSRVILGVDLTKLELVAVYPDTGVSLGFPSDSYVSGIIWDVPFDLPEHTIFTATFKGAIAESDTANTPVVLGGGFDAVTQGDDDCSAPRLVKGPDYESITYTGGSTVGGHVYIGGALSGDTRDASIPLAGAVVDLVRLSSPYRDVLASTITDENGAYTFHGVTNLGSKGVAVGRGGFFRENPNFISGNAGDLVGVNTIDISFQFPFGEAIAVHAGLDNDLSNLLILDQELPRYVRPRDDDGFNGDAQSVDYWAFQVAQEGWTSTAASISSLIADAEATLSVCSGSIDASVFSLSSSPLNDLKKELFAAALNVADGRGIFEPFAALNDIFIQYGSYVACEESSPSADDIQTAWSLLHRLNGAGEP